jgi:hypothetical protein
LWLACFPEFLHSHLFSNHPWPTTGVHFVPHRASELISEEIIINSFKKTGISDTLDWTEDDDLGGRAQRWVITVN